MAVLEVSEYRLGCAVRHAEPTWLIGRDVHGETTVDVDLPDVYDTRTFCLERETLEALTRYLCTGESSAGVRRSYDPDRRKVRLSVGSLTLRHEDERDYWCLCDDEFQTPLSPSPHVTLLIVSFLWRTCVDGEERAVSFRPCPYDRGQALNVHRVTPASLSTDRARDPRDPHWAYQRHMLFRPELGTSRGEQLAHQLTALNPLPWAPVNRDPETPTAGLSKEEKERRNARIRTSASTRSVRVRASPGNEDVRSPALNTTLVFGPQYPYHDDDSR